uniref:Kringle domain-containing protein n=1 Tax=Branchiostoma floridae TaxID=7739 RepID=C3XQW4_BRAFL|eukprot:XP_002613550.1 hypothetical protein BRAFLDRAFT_71810 [Branchiostoma floridae]
MVRSSFMTDEKDEVRCYAFSGSSDSSKPLHTIPAEWWEEFVALDANNLDGKPFCKEMSQLSTTVDALKRDRDVMSSTVDALKRDRDVMSSTVDALKRDLDKERNRATATEQRLREISKALQLLPESWRRNYRRCYTTDPSTRWEYCDVPVCGAI